MITYYKKNGNETPSSQYTENDDWKYLAKYVEFKSNNETIVKRYFVKMRGAEILDGRNLSDYEIKNTYTAKFKEVPSEIFNKYIKYLRSETNISLSSIRRLLNG